MSLQRKIHTPALLLSILCLAFLGAACQSPPAESPPPASNAARSDSETRFDAGESGSQERSADDAVSYEPAYPADVSTDGLDADDTSQQQTHSHGGAEHSHEEGEHLHGDDHGQ